MKNKRFFGMIVCALLAIGLVLTGCPTEDDSSGGGGGNGGSDGMGSITITGMVAGLNDGKIALNTVSGSHEIPSYTLQGGQMSGTTLDRTGSVTISGGTVTIHVRGISYTGFEFKDGTYTVTFTVTNATNAAYDGVYRNLAVTFSGSRGTLVATQANGLGN